MNSAFQYEFVVIKFGSDNLYFSKNHLKIQMAEQQVRGLGVVLGVFFNTDSKYYLLHFVYVLYGVLFEFLYHDRKTLK